MSRAGGEGRWWTRRAVLVGAMAPVVARALPAGPRLPPERVDPASGLVTRSRPALGTAVEVALARPSGSGASAGEIIAAIFAELERVGHLLSHSDPESDIARINAAAGSESVVVQPETFALIQRCAEFSEYSGGVFDITYAAMGRLWQFDLPDGGARMPKAAEVARLRKLIDYRRVILEAGRRSVMLPSAQMRLGLGAIMRGYALDRASRIALGLGATAVRLRARDLWLVRGELPTGPLRVGVDDPRDERRAFVGVELRDDALSTTGDYERFFVDGGKRYHNIIDPRTGYPARACRSASVLAPTAVDADWLAKTVFILGLKEARPVLARVAGAEALVVTADNVVEMTDGMKRRIELLAEPTAGP